MSSPVAERARWQDLGEASQVPRLEPVAARALNRIYARQMTHPFSFEGKRYVFSWVPDSQSVSSVESYGFRFGPYRGRLGFDMFTHALVMRGERHPGPLPAQLRYVLVADALFPLVQRLERAGRLPFEWVPPPSGPQEASTLPAADSWAVAFRVTETVDVHRYQGIVTFDDLAAVEMLAQLLEELMPVRSDSDLDWLRLPVAFRLGTTSLPLSQAQALQAGDVVRIDSMQLVGGSLVLDLVANRWPMARLAVQVDGARILVHSAKSLSMDNTPADTPASSVEMQPSDTQPDKLDGMEVVLRFEVGVQTMALGELKKIGSGHVFELHEPLSRCTVRISAQGNVIGKGYLVAVGDRLGVRVVEFAARTNE